MIVIRAAPCTVFSSMQNINQKHHQIPEWDKKYAEELALLEFSVDVYWSQISRGQFFLDEHLATAASWECTAIQELAEHPGVVVVTGDMCKWGMHLAEEMDNQGTDEAARVKKPTKWMINSSLLASVLSARCPGRYEHSKLEGSNRTRQSAVYLVPLYKAC